MSSGGHSWHKKDWLTAAAIAAAAAATAGSAGAFAPAAAAGAGAGAGAGGAASGLLGMDMILGNTAPTLAGLTAPTVAATSAAPAGAAALETKALGEGLIGKFMDNKAMPKIASSLLSPPQAPPPPQGAGGPPAQPQDTGPTGSQIVGNLANGGQLPPGITPEMLKDPRVIEMLKAKGIIV